MLRNLIQRRLGAIPGLIVISLASSLALLPSAGGAASSVTYVATVAPSSVAAASTTTFTATITNQPDPVLGTIQVLASATISVPAEFPISSVGSPTAGWTATRSGQNIQLTNTLATGTSVSVPFTAIDAGHAGFYTFATSAMSLLGAETRSGPDPAVQVVGSSGTIVQCSPSNTPPGGTNPCQAPSSGGTLKDGNSRVKVVADAANSNDLLALDGTGQSMTTGCGSSSQQSIQDVFYVSDPSRSKTFTYVTPGDTKDICWMAASPFTDKFGRSVTTGALATCSPSPGQAFSAPPPCISSKTAQTCVDSDEEERNEPEDEPCPSTLTYVIKVPQGGGDPGGGRSIAGIYLP